MIARQLEKALEEAAGLTWKDQQTKESPYIRAGHGKVTPVQHTSDAETPEGRYHIYGTGSVEEPEVDSWYAEFFSTGTRARTGEFVTKAGKVLRRPTPQTWHNSLADAKAACEKHHQSLIATSKAAPADVAAGLSPDQKKFLGMVRDGKVPEEFGTKSERPLRTWITRMRKDLVSQGLLDRYADRLTPRGREVAKHV